MNYFRNVCITPQLCHSHATAIFFLDCCQFVPSSMFVLKMELMACANLVRGTKEKSYIFSRPYMTVSMIWHNSDLSASNLSCATAIFVIDCCKLALAGFLGWNLSLWPVPTWFAVQRIKDNFFLVLYDSINDMKHLWNVCITPQPCHIHFCCWLLPIWS